MDNELSSMAFTAFYCLAAGLAGAVAFGEFRGINWQTQRFATGAALTSLIAGFVCHLASLGRPVMVLGGLRNPGSSLFNELVTFGGSLACLIAYIVAQSRSAEERTCRILAYATAAFSFGLVLAIGFSYVMPWREVWNTYTLPLPFVGAAILFGCLSFEIIAARAQVIFSLAKIAIRFSVLAWAAFVALYCLAIAMKATPSASESLTRMLSGDLAPIFWIGTVFCGMIIPFASTLVRSKNPLLQNLAGMVGAFIGTAVFQSIISNVGASLWHFFEHNNF